MLALCLAATLAGWAAARRTLEARAEDRLQRAAQNVVVALQARAQNYEDLARSSAGFYAGSEEVTPAEFRTYLEALEFPRRDPAFVSLAFIEPVRAEDIPAWVEARSRAGSPVELQKAEATGESYLIRLFEPAPAKGAVVGLNAGANAMNRAALDAARDAGEPRLVAPLPLAVFPSDHGAALQVPVQVPAAGGRVFRGWMSVMFRFHPLMEEALGGTDPEVAVALFDGSEEGNLLFASSQSVAAWPAPVRRQVLIEGHAFALAVSPRPGFAASVGTIRPLATLGAGLLMGALLFGIVWSLGSMQRRAVGLAEEMTRSLRESERRYESLFEQNLAGIYRSTPDGRILECNEAFARMFGYGSRQEALQANAIAFYRNEGDREAVLDQLRAKGTILNLEGPHRRRDGTTVWTLEHTTLRESDPPIIEGTILDVTDRRRALEALRESEERYRNVFQHLQDGVFVVDPEAMMVLDSNPALQQMLGYSPAEMRGQSLYAICADDHAGVDASVALAMREKVVHIGERRYRKRDGLAVAVEVDAFRLEEAGRPVLLVVARNLAERQRLEAELRQAQKMEAVGRLAGGVAHDFNNLLTAILGYSDLILTGDAPEDVRQNVEEVRKAAERAATLTRQLLAFSRKQVLQPRVLDLNDAVKNVDKILHRVLRENVKIVHDHDPHLWRVKADPGQVEQVLMNLAVNASDAMPEGGRLKIRTRNLKRGPREPGGLPMPPGDYVLLEVSDEGEGMDAETLAHAFEPFFTTKERGKGTGLGLATVYGIVKQSGGFIEALSEPGKGSTFRIYLPRAHGAADSPSNVSPRPSPVRGSETILLVEDEEAVRSLAQRVLGARGYRVLLAESAEEALEISRAHVDRIHLLLTDVVLPGMDGHRLAGVLRAEREDLAVLFASGYFETRVGLEESEPFLRKPFTPEQLVEKVRSTLRKSRRPAP